VANRYVFLSHSSADESLALAVADKLRGVGVWVDLWNLDAGDLLPSKIAESIYASKWFVLIASHKAVSSRWIKYELNMAIIKWIEDSDYRIVVARVDDCEVPKELSPFVYVNTPKKPSASAEQILNIITSEKIERRKGITTGRRNIVDRFDEIAAIETSAHEGKAFIYLWGLYGIGKTTVVERAATEIFGMQLARFMLTEGHGLLRLALELAAHAGRELPRPQASENDLIGSALESIDKLVATNRVILFDDFEFTLTEEGELSPYIQKLFDAFISRGKIEAPIFICSTQQPKLPITHHKHAQIIRVNQLRDRDLLFCFENWLQVAQPDGQTYKRVQLEQIVPNLYGYPLGAKLASYLVVTHSPEYLLKEVRYFTDLRIDLAKQLLGRIRTGLDPLQMNCLQALSLVDEGVLLSELADVLEADIEDVRRAIDKNAEAMLVFLQGGLLQTHPLIRDYFWSRAYESGVWKELTEKYGLRAREKLQQPGLSDVDFVRLCSFAYRMLTFCGRYDDARALAYQFSEQLREASSRLYHAKDYELSLKYAETWLAIDPNDNDIRWLKARCLTRLERSEEAEKELEELQGRDYRKDKLYHAWGLLRRDQDNLGEAMAFFIKGLKARPNYPPLLRDFGDLQERMGDLGGALETLAKAYDLAPRDPYIAPKYADLLMRVEKPADALTVIDGALAAFPEEAAFEHRESMILDELGREEEAYSHAKRAVEDLNSAMPEALLHLATLELKVRNSPENAKTYLDRLPPRLPGRVQRVKDTVLADINRRSGDTAKAKEILRKYTPSEDQYIANLVAQIELDECSKLIADKNYVAAKGKLVTVRKTLEPALKKFPRNQSLLKDWEILEKMESQL